MADLSSLLGAAGVGGTIGQAVVRLELDTKKYLTEMKAAEGQTIASTNAMGTNTSKFAGLAQTALLGVGVAAVAGAAMSVKAAVEANDAHLKLQNTFANNASLADSSVEAFERQADALRDLTGVDDEAIITSQALLGQFDLTGQQVMELTPLIVDLSEKMDIDLQAASKAVGKATQGNAGILSRYGIVLDETALKTDAFGTTLRGLGVVQGFAAESAKLEPWRVLGAQFEELSEQVGQALLPALQAVVPTLIELVHALTPVLDLIGKLAPAVRFLAEGFEFMVSPVAKVVGLLQSGIEPTDEMVALLGSAAINLGAMKQKAEIAAAAQKTLTKSMESGATSTQKLTDEMKVFELSLAATSEETRITRKEFREAFNGMVNQADDLNRAMKRLSVEKWVNDDFVTFLSEKGPEWIIRFANLSEEKQRKFQEDWEESNRKTKQANENFATMTGLLDHLDRGSTKHEVIIQYRYEGFDPSKPGMSGSAQQR